MVAPRRGELQPNAALALSWRCPHILVVPTTSGRRTCGMIAKKQLTDRGIAAMPAAAQGKRQLHYDALVPGLAVRVTDRGAKSFVLVGRFPGSRNPTARAIGRVGAVTLLDARARAREWLAQLAAGVDPALAKGQRSALTFRSVAEDFQRRDGAHLRSAGWRLSVLVRTSVPGHRRPARCRASAK